MARVTTFVQGLRQAVGFFFAYFDYRRRNSSHTCMASAAAGFAASTFVLV
jgi:hypothetical protein